MRTKALIWCTITFLLLSVFFISTAPPPKLVSLQEFRYGKITDIKGFGEGSVSTLNADSLSSKYKAVRAVAKAKAANFIVERNLLNIVYQVLCILAVLTSLIVSYLGSTKAIYLDANSIENKMDAVKKQDKTFKKRIIFLSILSLVLTTASNRTSSFYDKAQSKANEIIDLIKNSDLKVTSSINLHEVSNAISSLELDTEKY